MKKAYLRSLGLTLAVITFLIAIVIIAYAYISDKVLTDNIGDNLTTILDTTKHTLSNNLEADYKRLNDQVSVITEGIEDENSVNNAGCCWRSCVSRNCSG
jgi:Flp pilus assembly pilin Flp